MKNGCNYVLHVRHNQRKEKKIINLVQMAHSKPLEKYFASNELNMHEFSMKFFAKCSRLKKL